MSFPTLPPIPVAQPASLCAVVDLEGLRRIIDEVMTAHAKEMEAVIARAVEAASAIRHSAVQPTELLSEKNLASRLGISTRTVRRLERGESGFPAAIRVGGVRRWRPEEIEHWLELRRSRAPGLR